MEESTYVVWKNKFLVRESGCKPKMYRCGLCGTGAFPRGQADKHYCGSRHIKKLKAAFRAGGWVLVKKAEIFSRISKLNLPSWRSELQEVLLKYFLVDASRSLYPWPYSRIDGNVALPALLVQKVEEKFDKFYKMEVASLLELVAWKLNCLYLDGSGNFLTMQGILDQWGIDEDFDPVEYKRQRRLSSNVAVIVERLLEFLW